jgi:hypothetical protein
VSAIYASDCACDLIDSGSAFPGLAIQDIKIEMLACLAWLDGSARFRRTFEKPSPDDRPIDRYFIVHGPGGHVIGVRP